MILCNSEMKLVGEQGAESGAIEEAQMEQALNKLHKSNTAMISEIEEVHNMTIPDLKAIMEDCSRQLSSRESVQGIARKSFSKQSKYELLESLLIAQTSLEGQLKALKAKLDCQSPSHRGHGSRL